MREYRCCAWRSASATGLVDVAADAAGGAGGAGAFVAWAASAQSDYVTGTTIVVDGGMSLYPKFV